MSVEIRIADARAALALLLPDSVHCAITSPPYYALRDYLMDLQMGLEGSPDEYIEAMVELFREVWRVLRPDGTLWLNLGDSYASNGGMGRQGGTSARAGRSNVKAQMKRHSTRPPISLKAKDMVGIPWRLALALQQDGAADWKACQTIERVRAELIEAYAGEALPDRVAVTLERLEAEYLEAKGHSWFLRQDIIWGKPNPMPESVRDRCTKAHEYFFLLSKSPIYYFDQVAISEQLAASSITRLAQNLGAQEGSHKAQGKDGPLKAVRRSGNIERKAPAARGADLGAGAVAGSIPWEGAERNKRDVWIVPTEPFDYEFCNACEAVYSKREHLDLRREILTGPKGEKITKIHCRCGEHDQWLSHFATFPPALIEPAILAGTSAGGCCRDCGAPMVRDVERKFIPQADVSEAAGHCVEGQTDPSQRWAGSKRGTVERKTRGWAPSCDCGAPAVPCTVLDPFGGAGTTGLVADRLQRSAILIELNPRYAKMAARRIADERGPMLGLMETAA